MWGGRRAALAAMGVALLVAAPAMAQGAEEDDPDAPRLTWTEACGDAATLLRTGNGQIDVGDTRNSPLDIRAVEARWIRGGLQMRMDVCGPLTAPDEMPRTWTLMGDIAGTDCRLDVQLSDSLYIQASNSGPPTATPTRSGRAYVWCHDPVTQQRTGGETVILPDDAWSVDGSVIRVRVTRGNAGPLAPYIPEGTVLRNLWATTFDARSSPVPAYSPRNVTLSVHTAGRDETVAPEDATFTLG